MRVLLHFCRLEMPISILFRHRKRRCGISHSSCFSSWEYKSKRTQSAVVSGEFWVVVRSGVVLSSFRWLVGAVAMVPSAAEVSHSAAVNL